MAATSTPDLGLTDALVQLSFAVQAALGAVGAEHDLSVTQLRLLGALRDREPGMLALATALNLEKSSVTGLVDRAERRGLVQRFASDHDGRAVHVRLTRSGRKLAMQLTDVVGAHVTALTADLSAKDRTTLSRLASRLVVDDAARRGIDLRDS